MAVMQKGCCPFCKAPVDASYGNGCALTHPPKKTAAQLKKGQSWDAVRNIAATSVQERVVEVSRAAALPPARRPARPRLSACNWRGSVDALVLIDLAENGLDADDELP